MSMIKDPINVIITGVGGQGNVLASQVVAGAAVETGYFVSVGETYGASQRGGSVMSHVRISKDRQYGPLIPRGQADIIIGFEPLETLRVLLDYGNPGTCAIYNTRPIYPIGCLSGQEQYPEISQLEQAISEITSKACSIKATDLAMEAGSPLAANMVMTGALAGSGLLPLDLSYYKEVVSLLFKDKILELNLKALELGINAVG